MTNIEPQLPIISIITPSYNQAQFLERTILSIVHQDYSNIQYLVVDGGSTDGSVEIIKKYKHQIDWWISEKDQGQADAVNKGINRAHGKYIGWLNSDDLYLPGTIRKAVLALEKNPQAGFVFGDVQSIDENDQVFNLMTYDHWRLEDLMRFKIIGQPGVFMRADVLKQLGGLDLSYHYLLDHHLWLRMGLEAGMEYVPQVWSAARIHGAAKNVAHAAAFGKEAYRLANWMGEDQRFKSIFPQIEKQVYANADRINARYLLDGECYRQSVKAYWHGFLLYPPAVWGEWHRFVYALLSILGLSKIKTLFYRLKYRVNRPDKKTKQRQIEETIHDE